jgi:hypothetical protein
MNHLEQFIREHRGDFDTTEPSPDHFRKFEHRLRENSFNKPASTNRNLMLRLAAVIVFLIAVSAFVFDLLTREIRNRLSPETASVELPQDIADAVQYYDRQAEARLVEITRLTSGVKETSSVCADATNELRILDNNTLELKKVLAENPHNERVQAAIIQNQQMKDDIMKTIINQLSTVRK